MDLSLSNLRDIVKDTEAWCVAVYGVTKSQTRLNSNNNVDFEHCNNFFEHFVYLCLVTIGLSVFIMGNSIRASSPETSKWVEIKNSLVTEATYLYHCPGNCKFYLSKKIQTQLSDWIATTNDKSKILLSTLVYKVLAPEFAKFVVN